MTGQFPEACARTSSHTTSKSNNLVQKLQKVFVALTFMSHANADASYFRLWCICKPARIAVPETGLNLGFDALGILRWRYTRFAEVIWVVNLIPLFTTRRRRIIEIVFKEDLILLCFSLDMKRRTMSILSHQNIMLLSNFLIEFYSIIQFLEWVLEPPKRKLPKIVFERIYRTLLIWQKKTRSKLLIS